MSESGLNSSDQKWDEVDDTPALRHISYPHWFKESFLDVREDLSEAISAGKQGLMVYFGQENCAYCEALMEVNFGLDDIVTYTRKHFDAISIDIWGARDLVDLDGDHLTEREFALVNDTNFTPSLIFYNAAREEAFKLRGYYPPYKFRAALEYVADEHYRFESFREYLARANPPPKFEVEDLNEQSFFERPPYFLDRSRITASQPLAVFFEQRDCHACDILHSAPMENERVLRMLQGMQVVQLDMWSDTPVLTPDGSRTRAREWAQKLNIFYAPTLVFFDEQGVEILRLESVVGLYRLGRVLQYIGEGGYKTGMDYQTWHNHRRLREN